MFGGVPTKFKTYKSYVEDKETGDKYWKVKNLTYKNNKDELFEYKIIEWVTENYPQLIQYSDEYVQQYRTVMDII